MRKKIEKKRKSIKNRNQEMMEESGKKRKDKEERMIEDEKEKRKTGRYTTYIYIYM